MRAYMDAYTEAPQVKEELKEAEEAGTRVTIKVAEPTEPPPGAEPTEPPETLTTVPPTTTTPPPPPTPKPWNYWAPHNEPNSTVELTTAERREQLVDAAQSMEESAKMVNVSAHELANASATLAMNVTIEMSELHGLDLTGAKAAADAAMFKAWEAACPEEWEACVEDIPLCPSALRSVVICEENENVTLVPPCVAAVLPGGGHALEPFLKCRTEKKDKIDAALAAPPEL